MPTILTLLQDTTLKKKAVLEKLICHHLQVTKEDLFINAEDQISEEQQQRIHEAYKKYTEQHLPLEYILGYVTFADNDFVVSSDTLIPRPETEYMIEGVREYIQSTPEKTYSLIDIGTGCGVLGLSVLLHKGAQISRAILTDISDSALAIAVQNYEKSKKKIPARLEPQFITANILDHKSIFDLFSTQEDVILVANLPYIPEELFDKNTDISVKTREPKFAFVGGDDGLDRYRVMFDQIKEHSLYAEKITFFFEMMTWQVDVLRKEYGESYIFEEIKTFHFNIRIVRVMTR